MDPPGGYYGRKYHAIYFIDPDGMKLAGMTWALTWAPPARKAKRESKSG